MFFSKPVVELPKITAPTAAAVAAKSNPSELAAMHIFYEPFVHFVVGRPRGVRRESWA